MNKEQIAADEAKRVAIRQREKEVVTVLGRPAPSTSSDALLLRMQKQYLFWDGCYSIARGCPDKPKADTDTRRGS